MAGPWEDYAPAAPQSKSESGPWNDFAGEKSPELSGGKKPSALKQGIGNVAAVADMVLGLPGQALQVGADIGGRARGVLEGRSRKDSEQMSKAAASIVPKSLAKPIESVMKYFGYEGYDDSDVSKVMGMAQSLIAKGGDWVEQHTKGVISKGDVESLANTAMFAAGAKGTSMAVDPKLKAMGQVKPDAYGMKPPTSPEPPPSFEPKGMRQPAGMPDIKTPAERATYNKQRRADARKAFQDDPDWADYLKRTADYEAEQRAAVREELTRLTPEEMAPRTRGGEKTAVDEAPRTLEQNKFGDLSAKEPTALDSGLAKVARGRAFDMTAEERLAVNKSGSSWNRPGIILPAALAATGLGLALQYGGEGKNSIAATAAAGGALLIGKGKGLTMEKLFAHADTAPLKAFLDDSAYTLNTLEKLPPNRFSFSKESIEQLLKRPEVTQAERDVFRAALDETDPAARDITAKELMKGVKEATGDWELSKAVTSKYADYGLEAIDRAEAPDMDFEDYTPEERTHSLEANTHVWQLPEHMEMSDANHFEDPRYFGHTRVFEESGIRHVVEIQSDLAQRAGKALSEEEATSLIEYQSLLVRLAPIAEEAHDAFNQVKLTAIGQRDALRRFIHAHDSSVHLDVKLGLGARMATYGERFPELKGEFTDFMRKAVKEGQEDSIVDKLDNMLTDFHERKPVDQESLQEGIAMMEHALYKEARSIKVSLSETRAKLGDHAVGTQVGPLLKNWHKRLVREELADAARGKENPAYVAAKKEAQTLREQADEFARREGWKSPDEAKMWDDMAKAAAEKIDKIPQTLEPEKMVRFATADTVAKVEGWPDRDYTNLPADAPGGQFYPGHQGIYDRYKKDVEKFLNQLGGKPYMDSAGHTWIEVPVEGSKQLPAGKRAQMFGGADNKLIVGIATLGLGAVVGANLDKDNPIIGALLGMVGAAGTRYVGKEGAKKLGRAVAGGNKARAAITVGGGAAAGYALSDKKDKISGAVLGAAAVAAARALPKYTGLRVGAEMNARDYLVQSFNLKATQLQFEMLDKVSDPARLQAIWKANEPGGSVAGLSAPEREVAQAFRTYYAEMDKQAKAAGVYKEGLDNYMARLHDLDPKDVEFELQKLFQKTGKNGGNPFSKERKFLTLEDAKKAGYTPVTENPVEMLGMYANSMGKAIADRNLVKGLMEKAIPESKDAKFVMPEKDAPRTYVDLPGAAMRGKRVHPDIADSLRFVFDARNPNTAMRAIETFNAATKRVAVMASLFHAKSLLDAAVGAAKINKGYLLGGAAAGGLAGLGMDDPVTGAQIGAGLGMLASMGKTGMLAARGTLSYLEELKRGSQQGVIDRALKGGLEITMEKHPAANEDMGGGNFYAAMNDAAKLLDKQVPGVGKATFGNLVKVNQIFDNFMWARLHTGLKLAIFDEKFNAIKENNAKAAEKSPGKVKLLPENEIAHIAASFTNDTFGGLNWRRIAEGAQTKFGRAISEAVLSPSGRRTAQFLMFAPDWTLSTTRAFTGAFGEGSGVKGLLNPRELADLHRQYLIRSALYYAMAGDGINYAMSGHHLWDNKDWTRLELGDGRTMQFSKHMMEPYHWLTHPVQQGLNKLSQPVKETANQLLGTEYLAPRQNRNGEMVAGPAIKGGRAEHALKSVSPIASQQSTNSGAVGGVAGFLGFPVYGQTKEQREEEKRRKRLEQLMQGALK